jgi:hypothetical protein
MDWLKRLTVELNYYEMGMEEKVEENTTKKSWSVGLW